MLYEVITKESGYLLERVAYQIEKKSHLASDKTQALAHYIQVVQREFNLDAIEVYDANAERLTYAVAPILEDKPFNIITPSDLLKPPSSEGSYNFV